MQWWTRLIAVDLPEGSSLQAAELGFRGTMPVWVCAALGVLLGALAIGLYVRERRSLHWAARGGLMGLRCLAIALLSALLARPVLLAELTSERPREVVLLLDDSLSMRQQDRRRSDADRWRVALVDNLVSPTTGVGGDAARLPAQLAKDPPRVQMLKAALAHPELELVERLRARGPLHAYLVGSQATLLADTPDEGVGAWIASVKAEQPRTALADALVRFARRRDADPPAAIVAMTDGVDNGSKVSLAEAADACAQAGVPLHLYGIGTTELGDLQLRDVGFPEVAFAEDTLALPLRWRAPALTQGRVEIVVTLAGQRLLKKEVPVADGEQRDTLSFVVPGRAGAGMADRTQDLTVQLRVPGTSLQDSATRPVHVIDGKIRVLYVENAPRWEYQFLQSTLLRDRRVHADFVLLSADPQVQASGPPYLPEFPGTRDQFFAANYHALILGDVPAEQFKGKAEWIRDFVQHGGGLVCIAGKHHLPSSYAASPLAELLPVEVRGKRAADVGSGEFRPELTDAGLRSDLLALADTPEENLQVWNERLPPLQWYAPASRLRPGALSLLVHPRARMDDQPMPLLAVQPFGKGQVVLLATDETWRWRFNAQDQYFGRFWGQVLYQVGLPSLLGQGDARAQFALERGRAVFGQPGAAFLRLVDRDLRPRTGPTVDAQLRYLDAAAGPPRAQPHTQPLVLHAVPGRTGEYQALLTHDQPGRHELRLLSTGHAFRYVVELPPNHELEPSGLAEKALREAAALSGGRFYREEDLHQLVESLPARTETCTQRQEILLWNPLAFVLLVALIAAEWTARKWSDLS